jgi:hypothetical protein
LGRFWENFWFLIFRIDPRADFFSKGCEINIQQKFFPNAVQLEFNGQKIVVKVLLFELSFSSNEQKLVQKLFLFTLVLTNSRIVLLPRKLLDLEGKLT